MSKFINNIEHFLNYRDDKLLRTMIPELRVALEQDKYSEVVAQYMKSYTAKVEYSIRFHCFPDELQPNIDLVVKQLKRDVYDDFVKKIIELKRAIYSDNRETALQVCDELFKEVE